MDLTSFTHPHQPYILAEGWCWLPGLCFPWGLLRMRRSKASGAELTLSQGRLVLHLPAWESNERLVNTSCSAKQRWAKYVKRAI